MLYNDKTVLVGYTSGTPPNIYPPRQDFPQVYLEVDTIRDETGAFSTDQAVSAETTMDNAGPSDRTNESEHPNYTLTKAAATAAGTTGPTTGRNVYDYKQYIGSYFSHYTVLNPNQCAVWFKAEVFAPRYGYYQTNDPAQLKSFFATSMYRSMAIQQYVGSSASTGNIDWKNLDTIVGNGTTGNPAGIMSLVPHDRTWIHKQRWKQLSRRRKVLIPPGATYRFRVFHKKTGPYSIAELGGGTANPYIFADRIIKMTVQSVPGLTATALAEGDDAIHTDFVSIGLWKRNLKTMKQYILNRPVVLLDMTSAQKSTATAGPSSVPQITRTQQEVGETV